MDGGTMSGDLLREMETFLYMEARLQDECRYEEWEALWTDDAIYWVPANADDIDPETQMSILFDNRSRIGVRVRQLMSGKHYTQEPKSRLRRLISNVEILSEDDTDVHVGSNMLIFESTDRGDALWGARTEHKLRREGNAWRMAFKKVMLVNNDKALYTLSFLI